MTRHRRIQPASVRDRLFGAAASYGGPGLIAAAFAAAVAWSWRKWPDCLVDFGQQLYIAWQLAEGRTLYRDIAYQHGPFSPYLNSVWFRMFGTGGLTLFACNIALAGVLLGLLYVLIKRVADRAAATAACLVFISIFGFGQYVSVGNYNYVSPYVHALPHGLIISLAGILALSAYEQSGRLVWIAAAGFGVGLSLLTKTEIFLAAVCAILTGVLLVLLAERSKPTRAAKSAAVFVIAASAPPIVAFLLLCQAMPAGAAWQALSSPWQAMLNDEITRLPFYREGMGIADLASNLQELAVCSGGYALVFLPPAAAALLLRRPGVHRPVVAGALIVVVAALLIGLPIAWHEAGRILPLAALAAGLASAVSLRRNWKDRVLRGRGLTALMLSVFALAMLTKMLFNARVFHYGFALAMPAAMILVASLVTWIPRWLTRRGGYGGVFRAAAIAALGIACLEHLKISSQWYAQRTNPVGTGADEIRAGPRGKQVATMLEQITQRVAAGRTLTVFPDGAMFNYLARRVNPIPYNHFNPVDVMIFGEDNMLAALKAHPPDFVLLVHKDTSEYGFRYFGRDYGKDIGRWLRGNYTGVVRLGAVPLTDERPGLLLLRRNATGAGRGFQP